MDPYEVLGGSRTAPDSVIKAAFRARIRETHPDAGGDPEAAQQVNDAYATLSDPALRGKVPPVISENTPQAPSEPAERPESVTDPRAQQGPATEAPHLVYTDDHDRRPLWKRRAAWFPVIAAIVIGAGTGGPFGAAAALAASALLLRRWTPKVIACAFLIGAAPSLVSIGTSGAMTTAELIPALIALGALLPVLAVWAVLRRKIRQADDEHAVDIFVSTRDRFRLDEVVVLELFGGAPGQRFAHVVSMDGSPAGNLLLGPRSFPIDVGDHVLMHNAQPFYAIPAALRARC